MAIAANRMTFWRERLARLIALLCMTLLTAGPASAYEFGPPDGVAGNPPYYYNCTLCHTDFEVNSGDGALTLDAPAGFVPGDTYDLTVTLRDPGQQRWGFELTALDEALQPAGSFTITDPTTTQLSSPGGGLPQYVKQTLGGTYIYTPDGPVSWGFRWTAPAASMVTFYLAGNAANADGQMSGDYIYTDSLSITAGATAVETGTWSRIKNLYRTR